jgi:hypothetical protein
MTAHRDLDRRIDDWLDLMPSEAPDRVIDAVLLAAETAPQARRPLVGTSWSTPRMNRMLLILATAALGVALAGGLLVAGGAFDAQQVSPVATPAATAPAVVASPSSPAAEPDAVPPELIGRWMGSPREGVTVAAGVLLTLDPAEWAMSRSNRNTELLAVGPAGQTAGELALAGGPASNGCLESGRYRWTLSPSGRVLTIAPASDDCAPRAALVTGTYWRSDCQDPETNCLGDLDPGSFASQYVTPLTPAAAPWTPVFGAITYTVPDGWANWTDYPGTFGLTPSADYASGARLAHPARWIAVLRDAAPESQATACSGIVQTGVDRTPKAFLAWLRTVPGLEVGKAHPIRIDGRAGAYADLAVDDTTLVPCGGEAAVEYMITWGGPEAIVPGERQRLILLDNGNGGLVAIQIHSRATTYDAFVTSAMPIVESLSFR